MGVEPTKDGLRIKWSNGGHESLYKWDWLHTNSYSPKVEKKLQAPKHFWGKEIDKIAPSVEFNEVMKSDAELAKWMRLIKEFGFSFVENVPVNAKDTKRLVERIGFVHQTHYGGFWQFTADMSKGDTAYSNMALPAHTDMNYYIQTAGLQLFHCLENTDSKDGGGSTLLVDGFNAARRLREVDPNAYKVLSRVPMAYHAAGDPSYFFRMRTAPILTHDLAGSLVQVRWNNDDRSTMHEFSDVDSVETFYDAMRTWNKLITSPELEYWSMLEPGKALIFDNWRVCHHVPCLTNNRYCTEGAHSPAREQCVEHTSELINSKVGIE